MCVFIEEKNEGIKIERCCAIVPENVVGQNMANIFSAYEYILMHRTKKEARRSSPGQKDKDQGQSSSQMELPVAPSLPDAGMQEFFNSLNENGKCNGLAEIEIIYNPVGRYSEIFLTFHYNNSDVDYLNP